MFQMWEVQSKWPGWDVLRGIHDSHCQKALVSLGSGASLITCLVKLHRFSWFRFNHQGLSGIPLKHTQHQKGILSNGWGVLFPVAGGI